VHLGQPTTFVRADVHRYLKGGGPGTIEFKENAANQCAAGFASDSVGYVLIIGLDHDDRGDLVVPWIAVAPPQFEGAVVSRLAEAGVTPTKGTGIQATDARRMGLPLQAMWLIGALAVAAAARLATTRYSSVSTS
jgi:hypothetical protein